MTLLTEPTRIVLAKGQPVPVDLQGFGSVSLLLHGDGTNGSTVITDSSGSPKTVTAVGNAQISTAESKFGGSSIAFDGNGDYLSVSGAKTNISGDFTAEGWIYRNIETIGYFFDARLDGLGNSPGVFFNTGQLFLFVDSLTRITISAPSLQTWLHVALVRQAGIYSLYLNGVASATTYSNSSAFQLFGLDLLTVGARGSRDIAFLNGYIDDLRITNGVARYTANFTPPTAPFPDF